jgi:hypothetical protein
MFPSKQPLCLENTSKYDYEKKTKAASKNVDDFETALDL